MAFPSHLAKYDGLIDLVVEQIVREIERAALESHDPTCPSTTHDSAASSSETKNNAGAQVGARGEGSGKWLP
jgi:hypothetical protein